MSGRKLDGAGEVATDRTNFVRYEPGRPTHRLVAELAAIHGLHGPVADLTYGKGGFWKTWRPDDLDAFDIRPRRDGVTRLDWRVEDPPGRYALMAHDPPFKLSGTPTPGFDGVDGRYGVDKYRPRTVVEALYAAGIDVAARCLTRHGHLLVKAQDQVAGGRVRSQVHFVWSYAEQAGFRIVDWGTCGPAKPRDQSHRGRQRHLGANGSTLLLFVFTKRAAS